MEPAVHIVSERTTYEAADVDAAALAQARAATGLLRDAFGPDLVAVYLYGSATMAGLRPSSDLDIFAVLREGMSDESRWQLARSLMPISRKGERPPDWRPLEVTVVAVPDIQPWRHPAARQFQYGEWLQKAIDEETAELGPVVDADVSLLITQVRMFGLPLFGPGPNQVLPEVPAGDRLAAFQQTVKDVMPGLQEDSTMGLLTLARVWYTLETGGFTSKDGAGDWAVARLDRALRGPLDVAVAAYRGELTPDWEAIRAQMTATADAMVSAIRRYDRRP